MNEQKIIVVGANSDLISPFREKASGCGYKLMNLTRKEWDLANPNIPERISRKIVDFKPNHILYAAGLNEILDFEEAHSNSILMTINQHLNVNCLSFLNLVVLLREQLTYSLTSVHGISSLYGIYGRSTRLPYSLSKHALEGAIKCLALEMPKTLVLGYRPGFFETKLTHKNISKVNQNKIMNRIPKGRFGKPEELSDIILNNITQPPMYCSGSFITMDGALTAGGIFST